jgi:hypothetical protein
MKTDDKRTECVNKHKKILSELIDTTRNTGNEIGVMFCESDKTGECELGDMCIGTVCSVHIDDCKSNKKIGSFHTHPLREIPRASYDDKLWAINEGFDFYCVGGYTGTSNHVKCYTVKKDVVKNRDEAIAKEIKIVEDQMNTETALPLKILASRIISETHGDDTDYLTYVINEDLTPEHDLTRAVKIIDRCGDSDIKEELNLLGNTRIHYRGKLRDLGNKLYPGHDLEKDLDKLFIEHPTTIVGKREELKLKKIGYRKKR